MNNKRQIIMQCFNWRINDVREHLPKIAEQGFNIIQLSPLQQHKEPENPTWYLGYQVTNYKVGNRLGTKEDLKRLCDDAKKYNISIIVDCVFNHVANAGGGELELIPSPEVEDEIRLREDFFHKPAIQLKDANKRYDCTQFCIGLPDLNTANHDLQDLMINYLKELQSLGVSGYRMDACKHIEIPEDDVWCRSDFWDRVLNSIENKDKMFIYGEILDADTDLVDKYCKYLMVGVNNNAGTNKNQLIQWNFSHDDHLTFNIQRNKNWNVLLDEWEYLLKSNKQSHMLFYPTDEMWRENRMKYINNTYK